MTSAVYVDLAPDSGFQMVASETDIPIAAHGAVRTDLEITGWVFRAAIESTGYGSGGAFVEEEILVPYGGENRESSIPSAFQTASDDLEFSAIRI
jgi:hypothetical protein